MLLITSTLNYKTMHAILHQSEMKKLKMDQRELVISETNHYNNYAIYFQCSPYAHPDTPVDVQHAIPAQAPAMKMVENVAYGAVLTADM